MTTWLPSPDLLAAPTNEDPPCGPDLEYDSERLHLEELLAGRPEQQYGSFVAEAVAPDWAQVARLAADQLRRSKDLRTAAIWTRAATHLEGLAGCAAGLELIAELLRCYWTEVHPADPEDDWWARRFGLEALGQPQGLPRDLSLVAATAWSPIEADRALVALRAIERQWRDRSVGPPPDLEPLRRMLGAGGPRPGLMGADAAFEQARSALQSALAWIEAGRR